MDAEQARAALARIATEHPLLRGSGYETLDKEPSDWESGDIVGQFTTALAYLQLVKAGRATYGSYQLKHHAERWGQRVKLATYVSNGALIAAALHLGLRVRRTERNADIFGLSKRDVERIERAVGPWQADVRNTTHPLSRFPAWSRPPVPGPFTATPCTIVLYPADTHLRGFDPKRPYWWYVNVGHVRTKQGAAATLEEAMRQADAVAGQYWYLLQG